MCLQGCLPKQFSPIVISYNPFHCILEKIRYISWHVLISHVLTLLPSRSSRSLAIPRMSQCIDYRFLHRLPNGNSRIDAGEYVYNSMFCNIDETESV